MKNEIGRAGVWKTREVHTDLWWGGLMERDHLEDIDVNGNKFKKCVFKTWVG
jgi:hypothetical protein